LEAQGKLGEEVDRVELLNTLNTHHGKIGATLLKKWEFSSGYIQIAMYHDNLEEADPISKELLVVHFANLLVRSMGYDQAQQAEVDVQDAGSTHLLKLDSTMIAHVKDQVKGRMEELKDIL
jgi:HD-like signal output (HDOD) protein